MRHEIIKTDNYLLVLDYKDVQPGDSFLLNFDHPSGRIRRCHRVCDDGKEDLLMIDPVGFGFSYRRECKRISAHLPLNGAQVLEGVDLLPPIEDDKVDKLAEERFPIKNEAALDIIECLQIKQEVYAEGYNKARENYKYTEEHVFGFLTYYNSINFNKPEYRYKHPTMDGSEREYNRSIDRKILAEYIQSLQQPKIPVAFESEINNPMFALSIEPKTITNPEGGIEWVGKYIYN